ncbi:MAG: dihydrolipoyl dehydrogenase [Anaerolineae bacterium]
MNENKYDVAIIGGGPGGYVAAIRAAQLGMSVALIEADSLGGVCVNWGCIPTKALLRNAEVARLLDQGREFGFTVENVTLDFAAAIKRSRKVSKRLVKGLEHLMEENNIEVIWGRGRLQDAHTIDVDLSDGGSRSVKANAIILATGARARTIPGVDVDGVHVLTAREALERRELPESAIIVGAGPIGLEFATVWSAYGTQVTVVEMLEHVLPNDDEEAAAELARYLRRQKIKTLTSTRVESVEIGEVGVRVEVAGPKGKQTLEGEIALIAIGVRPNSEDLGLEQVGVDTNKGWVQVDNLMRTSVEGIYAIGDLNGRLPLAHVASHQGLIAVEAIADRDPYPFNVNEMPRGTYTTPQVASFGLTEAEAREQGMEVSVGKFPFLPNGKALALGDNHGFVKIVAEEMSGEIVGAVIVGPEATELLAELVMARTWELTPDEVAYTVHAHPTLSEVVMEAAHDVFGEALHK